MRPPLLSFAAEKSDASMAALDSGLLPGLHRFFWPEGHPEFVSSAWLSPFAQKMLWWALVTFAVLDVVHPLAALTAQWWCTFFVLWIVPWLRPTGPIISRARISTWLSSLFLFSWLIGRTQAAVLEAVKNWLVFSSTTWWKLLSYPMHATIAATVAALLTVYPLRRVMGGRAATAMALLASLPYTLRLATYIFIPSEKPLVIPIRVYAAVMPVLIMAEVSSLLTRFPLNVDLIPGYRRLRIFAILVLNGRLNPLLAVFGLYGGALAAFFLVTRLWDAQHLTAPAVLAIYSVAVPASLAIVLLSALATWRSLGRAGRGHLIIESLATLGRLIIVTSVSLVALAGFFLLMPRTGYELSEALQFLPGPAWSISPTTTPGVLRLSGIFKYGVSDALASALARDPSIRRLELDSPGGNSDQGLQLGALVEKYTLSTFVGHRCSSACTFVFIAGQERVLVAGAKLGFHRGRSPVWDDVLIDDDKYNGHLITYFESRGVAASFARKAFRVSNDDIWYPSVDELLAAGVISRKPLQDPAPF
jgi:hypothetical protein